MVSSFEIKVSCCIETVFCAVSNHVKRNNTEIIRTWGNYLKITDKIYGGFFDDIFMKTSDILAKFVSVNTPLGTEVMCTVAVFNNIMQ